MTNEDRIHILREQDESWMRWASQVIQLLDKCDGNCILFEREVKEIRKDYARLRDMVQNMFTPDVVYPSTDDS